MFEVVPPPPPSNRSWPLIVGVSLLGIFCLLVAIKFAVLYGAQALGTNLLAGRPGSTPASNLDQWLLDVIGGGLMVWLGVLIACFVTDRSHRELAKVTLVLAPFPALVCTLVSSNSAGAMFVSDLDRLAWLALFAALLTIPSILLIWMTKPRRTRIYCIHCGYILYANESGICPECGNSTGFLTPQAVEELAHALDKATRPRRDAEDEETA